MSTPWGPWTVAALHTGWRLDRFVANQSIMGGRASAARWVAEGRVTVNGRRAAKSWVLQERDVVLVDPIVSDAARSEPGASLNVRLEREDLVVVDKPAGQPTVPIRANEGGALANALLGRYPEMAGFGYRPREPGVIHRLDTFTSGLVVAARTRAAFDVLCQALQAKSLDKRYLAIVLDRGLPEQVTIRTALSCRDGKGRVRIVEPSSSMGEPIQESHVRVVERRGSWAVVEVEAKRAFRHQVRVHLASRGWPIVGDRMYGGEVSEALAARHALHASHVAWRGGGGVPAFEVGSSLPKELVAFFER